MSPWLLLSPAGNLYPEIRYNSASLYLCFSRMVISISCLFDRIAPNLRSLSFLLSPITSCRLQVLSKISVHLDIIALLVLVLVRNIFVQRGLLIQLLVDQILVIVFHVLLESIVPLRDYHLLLVCVYLLFFTLCLFVRFRLVCWRRKRNSFVLLLPYSSVFTHFLFLRSMKYDVYPFFQMHFCISREEDFNIFGHFFF